MLFLSQCSSRFPSRNEHTLTTWLTLAVTLLKDDENQGAYILVADLKAFKVRNQGEELEYGTKN